MNGISFRFSNRVDYNHRIASLHRPGLRRVLAVDDELLVDNSVWTHNVQPWLVAENLNPVELTTVFAGISPPPPEDVQIVKLTLPPGRDVFEVTAKLRDQVLHHHDGGRVSPNHVLIPAYENHSCPSGPPARTPDDVSVNIEERTDPTVEVTVIDSGYQWPPEWGPNPLNPALRNELTEERLEDRGQGVYAWTPGTADVLSVRDDEQLDALAGHANFVAGVIAAACPNALVTIRNHNGGFAPDADDFPTEAAVARSLCQSTDAEVIDLGFAFAAYGNEISRVWRIALGQLDCMPVVFAPAGNQGVDDLRFPAALHATHPNVIGVGSHDEDGTPSEFSNHGAWVTCAAIGRNVDSTFLKVVPGRVPEDHDPTMPPQPVVFDGQARWNGTSFATPKVAAKVAEIISTGVAPFAAWEQLATSEPALISPPGQTRTIEFNF